MPNTISFTGFVGRQRVTLVVEETADAETIHTLLRKLALAQAMGFSTSEVELPPATETETIAAVVLRYVQNKDGSQTPVIDCYPEWNNAGTFGQYRWGYLYLNSPTEAAEFERAAGVELRQLTSLGVGVAPLQRRFGQRHPNEVAVKPFALARQQTGTDEQGKPRYKYTLHAPASASATPWHLTPTLDEVQAWAVERGYAANLLEVDQLIAPRRWWEFASAREAAEAIVSAHAARVQQVTARPQASAGQPSSRPASPAAPVPPPAAPVPPPIPGARPVLPDEEGMPW